MSGRERGGGRRERKEKGKGRRGEERVRGVGKRKSGREKEII